MMYQWTGGHYREFRGYVFWDGKPVNITDKGTLEAVKKDPSFKLVEPVPAGKDHASDAVLSSGCPKCGRQIARGLTMHIKYCKG